MSIFAIYDRSLTSYRMAAARAENLVVTHRLFEFVTVAIDRFVQIQTHLFTGALVSFIPLLSGWSLVKRDSITNPRARILALIATLDPDEPEKQASL
ncbi:hypothetical protein F5Y18DRAFT_427349 [Xylariaceae sp. FL1019]|nr:hypothetical protein F5Y18DRAFT_427349 [Xylariaceae sp. FL1019]